MSNQIFDAESFEPEEENPPPDSSFIPDDGKTDDELLTELFGEAAFPPVTAAPEDEPEDNDDTIAPPAKPRQPSLASRAARTTLQWSERTTAVMDPRRSTTRQATWSAALREEKELMEQLATAAATARSHTEALTLAATLPVLAIRLSPQSYRALWVALPTLVQGVAGLARLLYGRAHTRPLLRHLPAILENSIAHLAERVADGRLVTPTIAARVLARQAGLVIQQQRPRNVARLPRAPQRAKVQRNGHGYAD
jgi:hypothetical protein